MKTEEIIALSQKYLMNTYNRLPMAPVKGKGAWLWDADGKKYLDFVSGLAVCNLGHSYPKVLYAIARQARKLLHVSNIYHIDHQAELAELLVKNSFADKAFFCNSGAEANEAAVKLARKYARKVLKQDRYEVITMRNSFHGRTLAMITATGQEKFQKDFEPLVPGFRYADFGSIESLEKTITPQTIAVMVEPIQGEGGVRIASPDYFKSLRDFCNQRKLLLIFDEVQVGLGRTGTLFAYEQFGVTPDMMTLAKALGGGLPIGAMLARDGVAEAFQPGDHAATFGGGPFVTAVACETVRSILKEGVPNVKSLQGYLRSSLERLAREFRFIREVRGVGFILALDLDREARPLVVKFLKEGLLLNAVQPQSLRLLPPLIIKKKEIDTALAIMKKVFNEERSAHTS
ncbi:MAG: aspartate aminotransferase family protein [Deltaproteobacteria bacterium]|nr:aspartate aminotransferase family protein [Deltaproteobacteria bacterium]